MKIIFICSGNASRSPFAEVVMKKLLDQNGVKDVQVTSMGTLDLCGEPRNSTMIRIAQELGYEMGGNTQYMSAYELTTADLILLMSPHHKTMVTRLMPYPKWHKIHLFNQYCLNEATEIPDPQLQTDAVFYKSAEMIIRACNALLRKIT